MAAAALDALITSRPGDWLLRRQASGQRLLDVLHQQCTAAGFAPQSAAQDDVACLHSLFDVALEQGLGELLVDYVVEVCGDPFLTSADPVEAYLMDGRCVQQWAHRALHRSRARFLQGLQQGLAAPATATVLAAEAGRLHALVLVLRALAQPDPAIGEPPSVEAGDLAEAQRLLQAVAVAEWALHVHEPGGRRWGAFASEQEWRSVANRRRDAAAPLPLALADALQQLREWGCQVGAYPFASLEKVVDLFLTGATSPAAWHAKLAVLVYALADAGYEIASDSLRRAAARLHAFGVAPSLVAHWQAAFWLDDAARGADGADNLERACRILPGVADDGTPLRVVEALAARGAPEVALAVQRCRGMPPADLRQAQTLAEARLAEGLLTETVVEVERFLDSPAAVNPAGGGADAEAALAAQLAEWAAVNGQLQALSAMPLPAGLETAVLDWLKHAAMGGRVPGAQLPLFLLQRGALAAAVAASLALDQALAQGTLQEEAEVTRQRRAIAAMARRLQPASAAAAPAAQLPALPAAVGGAAMDIAAVADPAGGKPLTPAETRFSARLGRAGAQRQPDAFDLDGTPAVNGDAQASKIQPAPASDAGTPGSARQMRAQEWQDAMGLEQPSPAAAPSRGPRTRQAAKRQRVAVGRR